MLKNIARFSKKIAIITFFIFPMMLSAQTNVDTIIANAATQYLNGKQVPTISIGVYVNGQNYFYNKGIVNFTTNKPVTQNSIYEVASVTKLFTGVLLGVCVNQSKCQLQTPFIQYIPQLSNTSKLLPISKITMQELAIHTSSLPRNTDFFNVDQEQPNLTILYNRMKTWEPTVPIGTTYEYSNLGFKVLGDAIANAMNTNFQNLLQQWILQPLQMNDSFLQVPQNRQSSVVAAISGQIPRYQITTALEGGGGLLSSSNDILSFLKASMGVGTISPSLAQSFSLSQQVYFSTPNFGQGLGWENRTFEGKNIFTKNGAFPYYSSFAVTMPSQKIAVVVLANCEDCKAGPLAYSILSALSAS